MYRILQAFVWLILISLLFIFSTSIIKAQVIINEINASEEWVELFRHNDTDLVNLDGCIIYFQSSRSQKKLLTIDDNFSDGELFKIITTGEGKSYLSNSDSDTVWIECADFQTDQVIYPDNINTKSYARIPNGIGNFVLTSDITKNTENPNPTPEPTIISTYIPTTPPTTAPTQTATSTPKPTPTKTPTPKPNPTENPAVTDEPINLISEADIKIVESTPEGLVAGASISNNKTKVVAFIFVYIGLVCLGFGIYSLYKKIKLEYNLKNAKN